MEVGQIEGHPVIYNEDEDTVTCKDLTVSAGKLIEAFNSSFDREHIQGNLVMRKFETEITLGCFAIPIQNSNLLVKKVQDARNHRQN